jgi:hypothetical protein
MIDAASASLQRDSHATGGGLSQIVKPTRMVFAKLLAFPSGELFAERVTSWPYGPVGSVLTEQLSYVCLWQILLQKLAIRGPTQL